MKKRILLTAVALILVCALSIMGTVAFLKDTTKTVTNTFVAAGGGKLIEADGAFTLQEHEATKVKNGDVWTGKYEIKTDAKVVTALSYDIMPGMVIPKDPYVTITKKTATPAYLYIEVINNLSFSTKMIAMQKLWSLILSTGLNWLVLPAPTAALFMSILLTKQVPQSLLLILPQPILLRITNSPLTRMLSLPASMLMKL